MHQKTFNEDSVISFMLQLQRKLLGKHYMCDKANKSFQYFHKHKQLWNQHAICHLKWPGWHKPSWIALQNNKHVTRGKYSWIYIKSLQKTSICFHDMSFVSLYVHCDKELSSNEINPKPIIQPFAARSPKCFWSPDHRSSVWCLLVNCSETRRTSGDKHRAEWMSEPTH